MNREISMEESLQKARQRSNSLLVPKREKTKPSPRPVDPQDGTDAYIGLNVSAYDFNISGKLINDSFQKMFLRAAYGRKKDEKFCLRRP